MPNLLLDDGGLPKPQYESEDGTAFEPLKGRGGAMFVRMADGSNETLGRKSDQEAASGDGSVIALLKALRTHLSGMVSTITNIWNKVNTLPSATDTIKVNVQNSSINTAATINGTVDVNVTNTSFATIATITAPLPAGSNLIGKVDNVSTAALNSNMVVGKITVGTTPIEIKVGAQALANRRLVKVYNMSQSNKIYVGTSSGVTISTGYPIKPDSEETFIIAAGTSVTLYAVAEADVDVRVIES